MRYTVAEIKELVAALAAQYGADRIICSVPMPEGMLTRTATLICALIKEPSAACSLAA